MFACWWGLLTSPAIAQTETNEPLLFSLEYTTPDSCPSPVDAFKLIRKRSRRVRLVDAKDASQHLEFRVIQTAAGFEGEFTVTRNAAATDSRRFNGQTCLEVVDALALTAALSLDPDATVTGSAGADSTQSRSQESDDPALSDSTLTENVDPLTQETTKTADDGIAADSREPQGNGSLPTWHISAGLLGSFERVMDTSWHAGFGLAGGLRRADDRIWIPFEFALELRYLSEVVRSEDELATRLALARFSYCLLRLGSTIQFLTCPTAQLGLLVAQGEELEVSTGVSRLYATGGLQTRLRGRLNQQLEWQIAAAINLPLIPRRFAVEPGPTVIGSTSSFAFDGALTINWVF